MVSGLTYSQDNSTHLKKSSFATKSLSVGLGYANVFDTYLSPQEYKGVEIRVLRESMRMTNWFDGNISIQNLLQAHFSYTDNYVKNNNSATGLVNWNYGVHYQFKINPNFKILAGALSDLNLGFIYNLRNGNNPASAKFFHNIDASAMAVWKFSVKQKKMTLRYQLNIPFIGFMFSPHYGQSYYEIFSLGNKDNVIRFTSFHNQPSLRQLISLDVPIKNSLVRFSYLWDAHQSKINQIKTHIYGHSFLIGYVKNIYRLNNQEFKNIPDCLKAY